ncbi:MAG: amidohydrolase [Acidobacteriota bacterium]|nr:amidohydrolase [Acidobacteriota bacterium]
MIRRDFLKSVGVAAAGAVAAGGRRADAGPLEGGLGSSAPGAPVRKFDLHTHYYPEAFFQKIREVGGQFAFTHSPTGQTIITYGGARFFGITPPMTDVSKRLEDMDRVGVDVEVVSLSTPNIFFAEPAHQPEVARMVNDAYADLVTRHPTRFKAFASIPMDVPDAALAELRRTIGDLKMNGVILLSNIRGRALTDPAYRPFFEEANRMKLCIFLHPMLPVDAEPYREYVLGPIIGFPVDTTIAVARMCYDGMFKDFPDIRWLVAHAGGAVPYLMERMDTGFHDFAECKVKIHEKPSTYLKRLYYDTVTFSHDNLRMVRDLVGTDRMVMASDYPHLLGSIDRAVSSIETFDIPADEKRNIFEGTALRILNNV